MARKRVNDFELTLSRCAYDKLHVFNSLSDICNGLIVSEEKHEDNAVHFHCYLELKEKMNIIELREFVVDNMFITDDNTTVTNDTHPVSEQAAPAGAGLGEGLGNRGTESALHISSIKNRNSWITYITKEDEFPLYQNISTSKFHRNFNIRKYVRENEVFNLMDTVIVTHIQYARIIQDMHTAYWSNKVVGEYRQEAISVAPNFEVAWVKEAADLFGLGKHLYIVGDTGVGKSLLARHLSCKFKPEEVLHLPCGETIYELSGLTSLIKLVICEDIGLTYLTTHRQQFLIALDRGILAINVKCKPITKIRCQAQFLFLSNYHFCGDPALARRISVIEAKQDGFQEKNVQASSGQVCEEVFETDPYEALFQAVLSSPEESGNAINSEGD